MLENYQASDKKKKKWKLETSILPKSKACLRSVEKAILSLYPQVEDILNQTLSCPQKQAYQSLLLFEDTVHRNTNKFSLKYF